MSETKSNSVDFVAVAPELLEHCGVKAAKATDLTLDEVEILIAWCAYQSADLWDGMSLQEILNVYRVSAEWENFEAWAQDEGNAARAEWNRVTHPHNHLLLAGPAA